MPVAALAILVIAGALAPGPALAAGLLILVAMAAISMLWHRDLALVLAALGRTTGETTARAWLPATARIERQALLVSRSLAARATEVERLLRAEAGIVERLPDPLLVLGADRGIRRTNAAARRLFGAEMGAVLRHPELRSTVDAALAGQEVRLAAVRLSAPIPREVQATVIPLDPPLAGGGQAIVVLSDRTHERAVERMRADFVANASHELRTPLASVIGFIETLQGPAHDDPPARERFLAIMAEQAARMNRLIDDLLSLTRIEVVEHRPPDDLIDLGALLRRVAAIFEPLVADRGMRLLLQIGEALPPIPADADQLEQVVQNLLDNAIKYGRDGGTVRLGLAHAAPGERWPPRPGLVLRIEDDGAGIARRHLPRLTERFYRVDKGRSRAVGGTGLGLAIVKHIVNRHRGQLAIDSVEGEGSTFTIWLPLHDQ